MAKKFFNTYREQLLHLAKLYNVIEIKITVIFLLVRFSIKSLKVYSIGVITSVSSPIVVNILKFPSIVLYNSDDILSKLLILSWISKFISPVALIGILTILTVPNSGP